MTHERFEDLPVWQKAAELYESTEELLEAEAFQASRGFRDQLDRAALSFSNNIAEGFERGTTHELLAFLDIARGSAGEVRSMQPVKSRRAEKSGWSANLKSQISPNTIPMKTLTPEQRATDLSILNSLRLSLALGLAVSLFCLSTGGLFAAEPTANPAAPSGLQPDGTGDSTAAIQKAMDEAGNAGGTVHLPPGRYLVKGSLHIPPGVTLQGLMESPVWSDPLKGSIILATGGRGQEDGPALFELNHSAAVRGLTVWYPEQQTTNITPYSWTFHLQGHDNTVENVTLINSYNGIRIGPEANVRHRIRSVYGCVLRRGIFVDSCSDIGRIDNVQFHCHWWSASAVGGDWKPVHEFMWKNCEAFIFGRTDWEYVNNTFVFPVNIGYRFIQTKAGAANGQFCGIGADEAQVCVKVDEIQPMGLLISNGQFVCMHGDERIEVLVEKTCHGSVRLVNCAFWGPARQCVVSHSRSFVSLSDCYLSSSGREKNSGVALLEADGGKLQVRGCSFGSDEPGIALRQGLQHAIISENNGVRGLEITNEIGDRAVIANNEPQAKGQR